MSCLFFSSFLFQFALVLSARVHIRNETFSLPSGWDETAEKLYHTQITICAETSRATPEKIKEITLPPLGPFTFYAGPITGHQSPELLTWYAQDIQTWEPNTFRTYLTYLTAATHYIDFGTWVGPTLLFAAQMVEVAVGIEADPVAFAVVSYNTKLNRNRPWGDRVHLVAGGVGPGGNVNPTPQSQVMKSYGAGGSCSGFSALAPHCANEKKKTIQWEVNTFSLPTVMKNYHIPFLSTTFIKVDVESFECVLLPSWLSWIKGNKDKKPTFFISFHAHGKCSDEQYKIINEIAHSFKAILFDDGKPAPLSETWKYFGETLIFTDWAA